MKLDHYIEKYKGTSYEGPFFENTLNLSFVNGVYHIPMEDLNENNTWQEGPACINAGKAIVTKLDKDSELCDICFTRSSLYLYFVDTSLNDPFQAFEQLDKFEFTANKDVIAQKMTDINYLYSLAQEFDYTMEQNFDEDAQAYFIVQDFDPKVAQMFSENMTNMITKACLDSISSQEARELYAKHLGVIVDPTKPLKQVVMDVISLRRGFPREGVNFNDGKVLSWLACAVFDHKALSSVKLVSLPEEVINKLQSLDRNAIISHVYQQIDIPIKEIIDALWTPYQDGIYKNFDSAYRAAVAV